MIKKIGLYLLSIAFMAASVIFPIEEARAILPALVVAEALDFGTAMVLRQVAGRAIVATVGVAANDASWLTVGSSLTKGLAVLLGIGALLPGDANKYEIQINPGVVIPPLTNAGGGPSGSLGSYTNPLSFTDSHLRFTAKSVVDSVATGVRSVDGVPHYIEKKPLNAADFRASLQAFANAYVKPSYGFVADIHKYTDPDGVTGSGPVEVGDRYVEAFAAGWYQWDGQFLSWPCYEEGPGCMATVTYVEDTNDSVKRIKISGGKFVADDKDTDWTEAERLKFGTGVDALKFTGQVAGKASAVQVSVDTANRVKIQSQTQLDPEHYKTRQLTLDAEQSPTTITESVLDGDIATLPSTDPGTDIGSIDFPSDYARQGEAAAAANPLGKKLDTLHDDLTKSSTAPADPALPLRSEFEDGFFKGTFSKLLSWNLPPHTSTCPTTTMNIDFYGRPLNLKMDEQCALLNDPEVASVVAVSFDVSWLIAALFIVLWA